VTVVPRFQLVRLRVAGQLAEVVLVTRRLTRIEIAVVEPLAMDLQVPALRYIHIGT